MLDGDTDSRYQRPRGVLHHTQDGRRGSLGKSQTGGQCDQCNNRYYESFKRTQTDTHAPYHIPLLFLMAAPYRACVRSRSRRMQMDRSENQYGRRLEIDPEASFCANFVAESPLFPVTNLSKMAFPDRSLGLDPGSSWPSMLL